LQAPKLQSIPNQHRDQVLKQAETGNRTHKVHSAPKIIQRAWKVCLAFRNAYIPKTEVAGSAAANVHFDSAPCQYSSSQLSHTAQSALAQPKSDLVIVAMMSLTLF